MKDSLQQSYRNIAPPLYLAEIGQFFEMDYLVVSRALKDSNKKVKSIIKYGRSNKR